MSLPRKLMKLRRASPREAAARLAGEVHGWRERLQNLRGADDWDESAFARRLVPGIAAPGGETSRRLLERWRSSSSPRFFFGPGDRARLMALLEEAFPRSRDECLAQAEAACRGEFELFEARVHFPGRVPWNADPLTGWEWPLRFYRDLDLHPPRKGVDVKYVWELGRHQFLIPLAKAWWLTAESRYARRCLELIASWIGASPFKRGVGWTSALEVAFRTISWLWCYHFLIECPELDPAFHREWVQSLCQHGEFLAGHLSTYSSPYNHLVGELAALYLLAETLPFLRTASRWRRRAWKALVHQVELQFHPDGGSVEQANFYHHATLGFYLLAAVLRRRNGGTLPGRLTSRLERALEYHLQLLRPDGRLPMTGDIDSGRSLLVARPAFHWDFRAFLNAGAILFARRDMKALAPELQEEALWLLGLEGYEAFQRLRPEEPAARAAFLPHSGYFVFRSGWDPEAHYLALDCGPQAHGLFHDGTPSAAHGHPDCLAVEVAAWGVPFLVDPGFHTYYKSALWSDAFRKTRAHNTVEVDGRDQSRHLGGMDWCFAYRPRQELWVSTAVLDLARGSHDGYRRPLRSTPAALREGAIHRRTVCFRRPRYWLVRDEILGSREHALACHWHGAPGIEVSREGCAVDLRDGEGRALWLEVLDAGWQLEIAARHDPDDPDSGWVAPGYGLREPARALRFTCRRAAPAVWHTLLLPYRGRRPAVRAARYGTALHLRVEGEDFTDEWLLNPNAGEAGSAAAGIWTDASWLHVQRDTAGEVTALCLVEGREVRIAGGLAFRAGGTVRHALIRLAGRRGAELEVDLSPPGEYEVTRGWPG